MSKVIEPTVGRVVHFFSRARNYGDSPLAAIVTGVLNDRSISATVFPTGSPPIAIEHVRLVQPDEAQAPDPGVAYCSWMPYQVTKSYGSESGEPLPETYTDAEQGGPGFQFGAWVSPPEPEDAPPDVVEIDVTHDQLYCVMELLLNMSHRDRMDAGLSEEESIHCENFYQAVGRGLSW